MSPRSGIAIGGAAAVAALSTAAVIATNDSESAPQSATARRIVGCDDRSMANFPGGFTSRRNLVVGPLALQGAGEPTPPNVVREFGGNKFPLLVKAGHAVTVLIAGEVRRIAGLAYGPLPEGEVTLRDTRDAMRFVACRRGQRSGSRADGEPVTFWSGFVVLRRPACVPLKVYVDDDRKPRRALIDMGGRDCGALS